MHAAMTNRSRSNRSRSNRFRRFTVLTSALLLAGQADTLRLRNGSTVTGSWLGGTTDEVRFMVDDRVQRYPRAEVVEVDFTSLGASDPVRPIAPITTPPPAAALPDVTAVPFMRGGSGLISLEMEFGQMVRNNSMYGMGGTVYRIPGTQSPVRVRRGDKLVFVVRLNSGDDPRRFQLYPLEWRMNYRQTQPSRGGVPVMITKIGDSAYEISPSRPLYPGEYAMIPINSSQTYCFGVD
jgi:hypothetical protein